jgi:hypothetical protein
MCIICFQVLNPPDSPTGTATKLQRSSSSDSP